MNCAINFYLSSADAGGKCDAALAFFLFRCSDLLIFLFSLNTVIGPTVLNELQLEQSHDGVSFLTHSAIKSHNATE